jgi:hypothetical protein
MRLSMATPEFNHEGRKGHEGSWSIFVPFVNFVVQYSFTLLDPT